MTVSDATALISVGVAFVTGGAAAWYRHSTGAQRTGHDAASREAAATALDSRVRALEDGQRDILRHIDARATKEEVRQIGESIVHQMDVRLSSIDARFADLVSLMRLERPL